MIPTQVIDMNKKRNKIKSYAKAYLMKHKAETEALKRLFEEHLFVPMYNEFVDAIYRVGRAGKRASTLSFYPPTPTKPNERKSAIKPKPTKPPTDGKQLY